MADDPKAARADRVAAVFALFANHLKPPCGPARAHEVLGEAKWLTTANAYPIIILGGWIPIKRGDMVHCLHVFPVKDGWSDSVIYLGTTGHSVGSADDLRDFFRGGKQLKGKTEMVEFALCYPEKPNAKFRRRGRIEVFDPKGMRVAIDD